MKEILKNIAPCGLACYKCVSFKDGKIRYHSQKLLELLGNFDKFAKRFSSFMPIYSKYPDFKEILKLFSEAKCEGCREGICNNPNCEVASCIKEKAIDFCYMCDDFPCEKMNKIPDLKKRWIEMNNRIKEIGITQYYKETKIKPRYE